MSEQVEMEEVEDRGTTTGTSGGEKKRFEVKKVS